MPFFQVHKYYKNINNNYVLKILCKRLHNSWKLLQYHKTFFFYNVVFSGYMCLFSNSNCVSLTQSRFGPVEFNPIFREVRQRGFRLYVSHHKHSDIRVVHCINYFFCGIKDLQNYRSYIIPKQSFKIMKATTENDTRLVWSYL